MARTYSAYILWLSANWFCGTPEFLNECDPVYKTHFLLFGLSDFGVIFYCFILLDLILHCHYLLEAYVLN